MALGVLASSHPPRLAPLAQINLFSERGWLFH